MASKLKIISLGGLNEIGKNLTVYEYGNDILVVDCGLGFPDDEMYGVDLHTEIPKIDVPIYIFSGLYDTAAPLAVSQEYINALSAPHKELIVMEQSGHILCRDDYEKMESAILERVAP